MGETPSQARLERLDALRADADRLKTAAQHQSLKGEVRRASRDTAEAAHYLAESNIDSRPSILAIVDMAIQLAAYRLRAVEKPLHTYGPGAMSIE
jgi:hypothetical protein